VVEELGRNQREGCHGSDAADHDRHPQRAEDQAQDHTGAGPEPDGERVREVERTETELLDDGPRNHEPALRVRFARGRARLRLGHAIAEGDANQAEQHDCG
jgi:hypothetical protein